jgi:hypothetical protein
VFSFTTSHFMREADPGHAGCRWTPRSPNSSTNRNFESQFFRRTQLSLSQSEKLRQFAFLLHLVMTKLLSFCLWLFILTSVRARIRSGDVSGEPFGQPPIRTDGCPWENDPVICGTPNAKDLARQRPRVYSSICFASRAGYELVDCKTYDRKDKNVASRTESLRCLKVAGVACGPSRHTFPNLCIAQVSGFRVEECGLSSAVSSAVVNFERHRGRRSLQQTDDDSSSDGGFVFCPMYYIPVYCTLQGTQFPTACEAGAAGYDPSRDCTVPDGEDGSAYCSTGTPNETSGAPIACNVDGTVVSYESICLASASGLTPSIDCYDNNVKNLNLTTSGETVVVQSITASPPECATSGKVQCGSRGQVFDNFCLARNAGFQWNRCHAL